MNFLVFAVRNLPLSLLRRVGIKSCILLIGMAALGAITYMVVTVHVNGGSLNPLVRNGPAPADRESQAALFAGKVRKGYRLQQRKNQETVVCGAPLTVERYKQKPLHQNNTQDEGCQERQLFVYSYKEQRYILNQRVLGGTSLDRCQFRGFDWASDSEVYYTEPIVIRTAPFITDLNRISLDFFEVNCYKRPSTGNDKPDFQQFLAKISAQDDIIERSKKAKSTDEHRHNVLVLSAEGLSDEKFPPLFADVIMKGYNGLGSHLAASFIPILTGLSEADIPEIRKGRTAAAYVDKLPFIWNKFENNGYVTLFAEDSIYNGIFNEYFTGFESPPTNHYMRPYWLAEEQNQMDNNDDQQCSNTHQHVLQYVEDFFYKYKSTPKFAVTLLHASSLSDINGDLFQMLTRLKTAGILDNTIVLLMSGHHYNEYEKYNVLEKLNNRIPFVALNFPQSFRDNHQTYMANLWANAGRLTTPFDIFHTLNSLMDHSQSGKKNPKRLHGRSLFETVPANRTCQSEGIPLEACSCVHWRGQPNDLDKAQMMAITDHINKYVKDYDALCGQLSFDRVLDVKALYRTEQISPFLKDTTIRTLTNETLPITSEAIQVVVKLQPNDRLYEITIDKNQIQNQIILLNKFDVFEDCLMEIRPELQDYCHCINKT